MPTTRKKVFMLFVNDMEVGHFGVMIIFGDMACTVEGSIRLLCRFVE